MSGLAIFVFKCDSLLDFEKIYRNEESAVSQNLKTLFQVKDVPSDTQMREIIDEIPREEIHKVFKASRKNNFGHGYKNLSVNFAYLMLIAFLIDQIQQSACGVFQEALKKYEGLKYVFARMRALFQILIFHDWESFFHALITKAMVPYNTT
jgi:hypothetical protein